MGDNNDLRQDLDFNRRDLIVGAGTVSLASAVPKPAGAAPPPEYHPNGLSIYRTTEFLNAANATYNTAGMAHIVVPAINAASTDPTYIQNIKWGEYQTIMAIESNWPQTAKDNWVTERGAARASLATQVVTVTLANGASVNVRKVDLLDSAVRACLNNSPPIAMNIDVKPTTDPQNRHDVALSMGTGPDHLPILNLTIYCPT